MLAPVKLCSCFSGKLCLQMMYKVAAHILIIPVRLPQGWLCLLFPLSGLYTLRRCAQVNLRECGRCLIVSFAVLFRGWNSSRAINQSGISGRASDALARRTLADRYTIL